jgi:CDP-paratose 2-epimerase
MILITGSLGLIGFESTKFFLDKGFEVIGIDNNARAELFNIQTHYNHKLNFLKNKYQNLYKHFHIDIRNQDEVEKIFTKYKDKTKAIIHTAAQTSHDWAKKAPQTDFSINAVGTLNLLVLFKKYCPKAIFIYTSTNKVYGDKVNQLSFIKNSNRYDLPETAKYYDGVNESMSIDNSTHSLFGVSKVSADLLVQEYGRYFGLKTGVFRLGVVTGSNQEGAIYQGYLSYFAKLVKESKQINILGYKGKQVRDVIHAHDVATAFYEFIKKPKKGEIYNLGGGRENSISINEILTKIKKFTKKKIWTQYKNTPRKGDHKWWITDTCKFRKDYPKWNKKYSLNKIIKEVFV